LQGGPSLDQIQDGVVETTHSRQMGGSSAHFSARRDLLRRSERSVGSGRLAVSINSFAGAASSLSCGEILEGANTTET
jgi:hypothetical protein